MKNRAITILALLLIVVTNISNGNETTTENFQQNAQGVINYSINKYTLSSGGGVITGGDYQLTSSIGQIDAGPVLTGGTYEFRGGFLTEDTDLIFRNGFE